ncbi:hypothetical protein H6G54_07155 [Anabaena cylindrica FACHB-243]|uniref:Uncharacterized protein n=1 Tax=Anabaena cylindrica (strain ATCC 27899 / PCC 7122) TaxID=272123 RepID=K9ZC15_ANACC|nr:MULTISPECIES: hypothetical protein [Anabaena]AFZ56259.1 hypothetical protein Anacy_0670 [Anabaena cylindrica PCC 7122]MBD2417488.1 hypothetical protein [Anabaena cylindrica FACHB-243]MBY5285082.1 hypothetical protein [Anabaena sp. CCAP 1446/1C]MBY5307417.1 hypothetical protein [Anabaena sp. CCAP 1446/1C]MCM2407655.1 hypothetical protein [Anabaena sp. CCAP 1446/1C]
MLQAIEGIYKDGKVKLKELPSNISESLVIVTFLQSQKNQKKDQIMQFGMFAGNQQSTEADFEIAEFYGDSEDI